MAGKIVSEDNLAGYQPWQPNGLARHETVVKLPTAEDVERIQQQAHREGYESGHEEGLAAGFKAGEARARSEAERLRSIADSLSEAVKGFEQELGQDVLSLSLDIAKHVLREALAVKPELLLSVVRGAIESLPQNVQHPHLHLHPEDAGLVREWLASEMPHTGWKVIDDPRVVRGGCRIESATAEVDATLPSRWKKLAEALGQDHSWLDDNA